MEILDAEERPCGSRRLRAARLDFYHFQRPFLSASFSQPSRSQQARNLIALVGSLAELASLQTGDLASFLSGKLSDWRAL